MRVSSGEKVGFGDIEVSLEARNTKPKEVDIDHKRYIFYPAHTPFDLNIVLQVATSTRHCIYFLA